MILPPVRFAEGLKWHRVREELIKARLTGK